MKEKVMEEINPRFTAITSYYNDSAERIGDKDMAILLTKMGIAPTLRDGNHEICSIGFCEREQKWYGWSHRAMHGFGIGDSVKRGDCAYKPMDADDYVRSMVEFWTEDYYRDVKAVFDDFPYPETELGESKPDFCVEWTYTDDVPNEKIWGCKGGQSCWFPEKFGRGEWTAQTLEDCRQMAEDFAEGVN